MSSINISTIIKSKPFKYAFGSWSLFIIENVVLSENRAYIIKLLNDTPEEKRYRFLYSVFSTAATGLIILSYIKCRNTAPFQIVGYPSKLRVIGAFMLQSLGLIGLSQLLPKMQNPYVKIDLNTPSLDPANPPKKMRCPFDFTKHEGVRGAERISRHYGLWSLAFIGLGSALITKSIPQSVWFSMPTLMAIVGGWHHDYRFKRGIGGTMNEELYKKTSALPFVGLVFGTQEGGRIKAIRDMCSEMKGINLLGGLGVATIFALSRGRRLNRMYNTSKAN